MSERIWKWLQEAGISLSDPRLSFPPHIERELRGELDSAVARGRRLPEAVNSLAHNVRLLQQESGRCLLYAVESVSDTGFWAVGIRELAAIQQQPLPWALVLLSRLSGHGYWLAAADIATGQPNWRRLVARGPSYGLTPADLENVTAFASPAELLALLRQFR